MLDSIFIKNYKNLNKLTIQNLEMVNLITGKNNTGKSTFLEAIALYTSQASAAVLNEILDDRGEKLRNKGSIKDKTETNFAAFSSLFTKRNTSFSPDNQIIIGPTSKDLFNQEDFTRNKLKIRFVKYFTEMEDHPDETGLARKKIFIENNQFTRSDSKIGLEIKIDEKQRLIPLESELNGRISRPSLFDKTTVFFVKTKNFNPENNARLWDQIALTDNEHYVVEALQLIDPKVERITFIGDNSLSRSAVVKLKGSSEIVPLLSLGDGLNRIFSIILSLINAGNGLLLIDEFENGLHYAVQAKLWELILLLSDKLNIQIFATTHSNDCIYGFQEAIRKKSSRGQLIRLDSEEDFVNPVIYTVKELSSAMLHHIETR